jgi:hypothetical protein
MLREFSDRKFENLIVDETDESQFFDRRDEFAAGDDVSLQITHAQQAFEIIGLPGERADDRLVCEQQTILAQRCLNARADGAATCTVASDLVALGVHPSVAPGLPGRGRNAPAGRLEI